MKRNLFLFLALVGLTFGILSCSGSGTSSGGEDEEADITSSGAAVAALFSSSDEAQLNKGTMQRLANLIVTEVKAQEEGEGDDEDLEGDGGERNTCDDPDGDGVGDGPEEVTVGFSGDPGEYGSAGDPLVVTEDDFCRTADGTENEGEDLVATFDLIETITMDCGDAGTTEITAASGVWRDTDDCFPQVYGTMTISGTDVDCTMCLNEDGSIGEGSSCTNASDGSAIDVDTDQSCTIGTTEGEDEEDIDDGEAEGEDEEDM